jgi:hypothetical protein
MRRSIRRPVYLIVAAVVLGASSYAAARPVGEVKFHDFGTLENDGQAVLVNGHADCSTDRGEWHLNLNLYQDGFKIKSQNTIGPHPCSDHMREWHARMESKGPEAFHPGEASIQGTLVIKESETRSAFHFKAATITLQHHDPAGP